MLLYQEYKLELQNAAEKKTKSAIEKRIEKKAKV